jgi:hypothetical protein
MSDIAKITESRQAARDAESPAWRELLELRYIADAVEGIRQDLTRRHERRDQRIKLRAVMRWLLMGHSPRARARSGSRQS